MIGFSRNHLPGRDAEGTEMLVRYRSQSVWGCSSAGRAPRSQRGGQRFDPAQLHQKINDSRHPFVSLHSFIRQFSFPPELHFPSGLSVIAFNGRRAVSSIA